MKQTIDLFCKKKALTVMAGSSYARLPEFWLRMMGWTKTQKVVMQILPHDGKIIISKCEETVNGKETSNDAPIECIKGSPISQGSYEQSEGEERELVESIESNSE